MGVFGSILLSSGLLLGSALRAQAPISEALAYGDLHESGHQLISPLLDCASPEARELRNFESTIADVTDDAIKGGRATEVGVFFRDLMNGRWFGIGEDIDYSIASMGKVALLVASLRQAEATPEFLQRPVLVDSVDGYGRQNVVPKHVLQAGRTYKIVELLEHMIVHSDNVASRLVSDNAPAAVLEEVADMFGLEAEQGDSGFQVSPRKFSGLFRVLFNASYLSRGGSTYALELLTRTEFKDGLVAGVPSSIPVAHKFGERIRGSIHQMHDCGIVYYPNRPYFLCVMSKGPDFDGLATVIRDVSRTVYREVDNKRHVRAE